MDTDLIARLREAAHYADEYESERELLTEAADALETKDGQIEALELEMKVRLPIQEYKAHLKARIAELEAALKPFADDVTSFEGFSDVWEIDPLSNLTVGDLRAARAALGEKE